MDNKTHQTIEINKMANIKLYIVTVFVTLLCLTTFYITFILLYERRRQLHVDIKPNEDRQDLKAPWYKEEELITRTQSCDEYYKSFSALAFYKTFNEREESLILEPFPLAFSHLVHKDIAILEVFLSLYFRPNNFH